MTYKKITSALFVVILLQSAFSLPHQSFVTRHRVSQDTPWQESARDGLKQVLIKISGTSDVIEHPDYVELTQNVDLFVSHYHHQPSTECEISENDHCTELVVSFNPKSIRRLLQQLGRAQLTNADRPNILLWITTNTQELDEPLVEHQPESTQLKSLASARGYPVYFPLHDQQDKTLKTQSNYQGLMTRYASKYLVLGQLSPSSSDDFLASWRLISRDQQYLEWQIHCKNADECFTQLIQTITDHAHNRHVRETNEDSHNHTKLNIEGITTLMAYRQVMFVLHEIFSGKSIKLINTRHGFMTVSIQSLSLSKLVDKLRQSKQFRMPNNFTQTNDLPTMTVQWQPQHPDS
ncbi:MAG: DUF2066 domain-containing protein [Pseudomonadota bacterium]|nr:DUF2066 domain-containing protein [Pseudomonadota bacterium]